MFSIILFFVIMWGLGFTFLARTKESETWSERNAVRIAIGISAFILLGVVFNFIGLPLDWKIFAFLALIYPTIVLFKSKSSEMDINFKLKKKAIINVFLLIILIFSTFLYIGGAFKYSYLEDDDPWSHAGSAKYVSVEKTLDSDVSFHYMNPYPPGFAIIMGVMHQTNDSINWTLKFFNGLILSLSFLFFYFFAKEFMGSERRAIFSTFVLVAIPSYFTHFIWSHPLVVMLIFPTLYCFIKLKESRRWILPAAVSVSGILLSQPSQALKIAVMFGTYLLVTLVYSKKEAVRVFTAGALGVVLSLFWWASRAGKMLKSTIVPDVTNGHLASQTINPSALSMWERFKLAFPASSGTATRAYTFKDFFIAQPNGGINVHVGWGIAISLLLVLGLIYVLIKNKEILKIKNRWILITLLWFIYLFLGTNAMTFNLPVGFITFRFWLLLAIPVALLSSLGWELLLKKADKKWLRFIITLIIVLAVVFTAAQQKYYQNTQTVWPPGVTWTSMEEVQGFSWLFNLEPDTKVFEPTSERAETIIGFDKFMCRWCPDEQALFSDITSKSPEYLYSWLVEHDYEYLILSASTERRLINKVGKDQSDQFLVPLLQTVARQELFKIVYQNNAVVIAKVI